jgi:hypothetical protein
MAAVGRLIVANPNNNQHSDRNAVVQIGYINKQDWPVGFVFDSIGTHFECDVPARNNPTTRLAVSPSDFIVQAK